MNLLIVEDDRSVRSALKKVASHYFDNIETAASPVSAIISVDTVAPSVLVTDWNLDSELSGVDVACYARNENPNCSIVFITGKSLPLLKAKTKNLGVHTYLAKPFSLSSIKHVFEEILYAN